MGVPCTPGSRSNKRPLAYHGVAYSVFVHQKFVGHNKGLIADNGPRPNLDSLREKEVKRNIGSYRYAAPHFHSRAPQQPIANRNKFAVLCEPNQFVIVK